MIAVVVGAEFRSDLVPARCQGDSALDGVFQLAYVPLPRTAHQNAEGLPGDPDLFTRTRAEFFDEMIGKVRYVLAPLTERRDVQRYHRNSVVQVAAEHAAF